MYVISANWCKLWSLAGDDDGELMVVVRKTDLIYLYVKDLGWTV